MTVFVRHAESEANTGMASQDPALIPLTAKGHAQAAILASSWPLQRPVRLIVSPFIRAKQTAAPLASRFGMTLETMEIWEFTYLSPERCAGTTAAVRRPWVQDYWERSDPHHVDGLGAESFANFMQRAANARRSFLSTAAGIGCVAVCHGQFIQALRWLKMYPDREIDRDAMRDFRQLDLDQPVPHCVPIFL